MSLESNLTNLYTTEADLILLMSEIMLDGYVADPNGTDADAAMLVNVIERATDKINDYCCIDCGGRYTAVNLARSRWIRHRATVIAAHFLTQRKGEPAKFSAMYDEIIAELEEVKAGRRHVPRMPVAVDMRPTASNQVVDDRFYSARGRVNRQSSSDASTYTDQRPDISVSPNQIL